MSYSAPSCNAFHAIASLVNITASFDVYAIDFLLLDFAFFINGLSAFTESEYLTLFASVLLMNQNWVFNGVLPKQHIFFTKLTKLGGVPQ